MSGNLPKTGIGSLFGATAALMPGVGPEEIAVQIAVFVAGFMLVWLMADLVTARRNK